MGNGIRRVVTGHDARGRAVVVLDGPARNVRVREAGGTVSTLMWVEDTTPADNGAAADKAERQIGVAPPPGGSVFRVVDFLPVDADGPRASNAAMKAELGLEAGEGPVRHPFMHRTDSVDYAVVISGEIDMLLDEGEVHLKAGDVVVQRGTNHAWVNRSGAPCRIAFVLIDAKTS